MRQSISLLHPGTLCFIKSKFLGLILGKVSNFALVIQLNITKDKFRIIIWSKFCKTGSFVLADPLVRHTFLKEFDCISIHNYSHCTYHKYCSVHGVEFVVMKRVKSL